LSGNTRDRLLQTIGYHIVKTWNLYLSWSWIGTGSWRRDEQNYRS